MNDRTADDDDSGISKAEQQLSDIGRAAARAAEEAVERLEEKLKTLESTARGAAKEAEGLRDDLIAETEKRVRANPVGAVLTALGIGFVLGLIFGVGRGR
jgi:ElaB/YqjD/DUF883 family membrane-anchored ribosome-binding protein